MREKKKRELTLFAISLLFIVGMMFVVAQNTNWLSFAANPERMMDFCLKRGFSEEQCEKLINKKTGNTGDAEVDAWCNSKCGGRGNKERKICNKVCAEVNTGGTCAGACSRYNNPLIVSPCRKQCSSLVMPTPTPTPTP